VGDTTISWTDKTWNPIRGCSRVSPGCVNCYAERVANRFSDLGQPYEGLVNQHGRWNGVVRMVPEHLGDPLTWRAPKRVFVNSMSDLFHESLSNEQIAAVFGVMAAAPQHTFQVLTKRAERMREWVRWARGEFTMQQRGIVAAPNTTRALLDAALEFLGAAWKPRLDTAWRSHACEADAWPLPNVWLGVSVENQEAAEERIPHLIACAAAVRFLSCEPLLGPVDLGLPRTWLVGATARKILRDHGADESKTPQHLKPGPSLDWLIAGCESGHGARPCDVKWLRSLRDQCARAGVAFWLKQAAIDGERCDECGKVIRYRVFAPSNADASCDCTIEGAEPCEPVGVMEGGGSKSKRAGVIELPYLDGVQHAAFPEVSRG
jgi:protein gp37